MHSSSRRECPKKHSQGVKNCIHYVASKDDIGIEQNKSQVCKILSAGHNKHEYTTGTAW
jgi:hypothetical protein